MASRQAALERELEQVIKINNTISALIGTIKTTQDNISLMNKSNNNTHDLLDQWIRILSQTNFTYQMINDASWNGVESNNMDDDEDDTEDALAQQLSSIERENTQLREEIEKRVQEREKKVSRANEATNKRRKELGLQRQRVRHKG